MLNIEGYELLEKIGDGGMATVWKARQLSLDRLVAIKIPGATSLPDQEARDQFRKEARNAARLNHPNIVQIYDTGEVGQEAYIVMEYVRGHTVGDEILKTVAIKEDRALEIAEQVARALAYAWEKECLIHCDIKPDNLLLDETTGVVKVADLGLARVIGMFHSSSQNDLIIGTPNYTAPEQSAGVPDLDCRTDMYSLGATLYHMVTGTLPFRGAAGSEAMNRHETDYLEDPQIVNPTISSATAWLIEKLMVKNRALRQHFWTQALKDIEAVRKGNLPYPPLPQAGESTIRRAPGRTVEAKPTQSGKLTLAAPARKKIAVPQSPALVSSGKKKTSRGGLFGTIVAVLMGGMIAAAALYYQGKIYLPPPVSDLLDQLAQKSPVNFSRAEPEQDSTAESADGQVVYSATPPVEKPDFASNEDFLAGAKLFNQALADYKLYMETREDPGLLAVVEENARAAIAHFEACRDLAPPHINIGEYIDNCYGLIANVRQSSVLDLSADEAKPPDSAEVKPELPIKPEVEFVDDEPAPLPEAPAPGEAAPRLLLAFDPGWQNAPSDAGGVADEINKLLSKHAEPTASLSIDPSVQLYTGIKCMMTAEEAAKVLGLTLPMRRSLATPGFPANSLFFYTFTGDFGWANHLTFVVDRNGRIVMSQLLDDRPAIASLDPAMFSSNWSVVDFINLRRRGLDDGLIAHRVRQRDNFIRMETELADSSVSATGERKVKMRAALTMPRELAGLILQANR